MEQKKQIYFIANWKANPISQQQVNHLISFLVKSLPKDGEVIICPPFVYLAQVKELIGKKAALGAQNCYFEPKGAFTGEISAPMLKDLGCGYVIIGHSERRKYFKETDGMINKKLKAALSQRMCPILCVGEQARDSFNSKGEPINEMSLVVGEQLEKALAGVAKARLSDILIAYEPVWAIGTGNPCLSEDAMKAKLFIRKVLSNLYDRPTAEKINILYGGSVDSKNASPYIQDAQMDGLLVGGASLNASEFIQIIKRSAF